MLPLPGREEDWAHIDPAVAAQVNGCIGEDVVRSQPTLGNLSAFPAPSGYNSGTKQSPGY